MGFFESILKKLGVGEQETLELDELISSLESEEAEIEMEDADILVKPIALETEDDVEATIKEIREGNIVLLNIQPMLAKNIVRLRQAIDKIKAVVTEVNGDIARITPDRIIVTPSRIKILKKRAT